MGTHAGAPEAGRGSPVTLARVDTPAGEVTLRRRGEVLELIVDGAFAMDTVDTSTEVALAREALDRHDAPARVLVGGLGLGVTVRAVLADDRVAHVDVVELAAPLVRWAREGLVPELAGLADDPRCDLHVADVAAVLAGAAGPAGPWDVVLLDVDNGPDFLVHEENAALYAAPALRRARSRIASGGVLVIWSSHRAPELLATLEAVARPGDRASETALVVLRGGRELGYALYALTAAAGPDL